MPLDFTQDPASGLPFHEFRPKVAPGKPLGVMPDALLQSCSLCGLSDAATVHQMPKPTAPSNETVQQVLDSARAAEDAMVADVLEEQAAEHKGVMVAVFPPPGVAKKMALGTDDAEPEEDLHVTLAYLPDFDDEQLPQLHQAIAAIAANHPPLSGKLGGLGHFNPSETSDGKPVAYAPVDVPGLSGLRERVANRLAGHGLKVADSHGFTPHMTLKYGEHDARIPDTPVSFDHLSVARGPDRKHFPLAGVASKAIAHIQISEREEVSTFEPAGPPITESAFFSEINGKSILTGPAYVVPEHFEKAQSPSNFMRYMAGRFVGGEQANRNRAFWKTGDLEFGLPTVAHGPLNWLHEARHIIGTITAAELVTPSAELAASGVTPHIAAMSGIWGWVYPDELSVIEQAGEQGKLWYSMECVSNEVACVGNGGCGAQVDYLTYLRNGDGTCEHLRQRAGADRHFIEPTFLGGAVIVPPVRPGWADAHASVMRQAASLSEKAFDDAGRPDVPASTWDLLMAQVLTYAGVQD